MKTVKPDKYYYILSQRLDPIESVGLKEPIKISCLDAAGENMKKETDPIFGGPYVPVSGPIEIKGTNKGDTLIINIEDIEILGGQGYCAQSGSWGSCMCATNDTNPVLNQALKKMIPDRLKICKIEENGIIHFPLIDKREVLVQSKPMIGTIGTAPDVDAPSIIPGNYGGNIDIPEVSKGNKLYLPVFTEGSYLYLGDGHAIQGDGEPGGSTCEVSMECTLSFDVIKGKTLKWPRIETPEHIITVGVTKPLDDAFRIASTELIQWMHEEYDLEFWDAHMLITLANEARAGACCAQAYSLYMKFPKKYLTH